MNRAISPAQLPRLQTRRRFMAALAAPALVAACGNGLESRGQKRIEARVDAALDFIHQNVEGARSLEQKAAGVLIMPLMTEAGFGMGLSYGRGALRIENETVDFYSSANASIGLKAGAQQYSHALYFMTDEALENFRRSRGWAAGADLEVTLVSTGGTIAAQTTTTLAPVVGIIFGQAGLIAGASLEGMKYSRILP